MWTCIKCGKPIALMCLDGKLTEVNGGIDHWVTQNTGTRTDDGKWITITHPVCKDCAL